MGADTTGPSAHLVAEGRKRRRRGTHCEPAPDSHGYPLGVTQEPADCPLFPRERRGTKLVHSLLVGS